MNFKKINGYKSVKNKKSESDWIQTELETKALEE